MIGPSGNWLQLGTATSPGEDACEGHLCSGQLGALDSGRG